MIDLDYLNVLLVDFVSGEPLVTFDTKKTLSKNSSRQRQCAVVANAGQRFVIEIQVQTGFDWAGCNGLEVNIGFDVGEEVNSRSVYILREQHTSHDLDLPYLIRKDGAYSHRIEYLLIENSDRSVRDASHGHFYFQHLRPDDKAGIKGLPRTLDSQGKIRVEVARTIINLRDQDRGLQTDVPPAFCRQKRDKILKKNITLEIVLRRDPANRTTKYRGNFRSDRPRHRNQQANFDFIYREEGCHDGLIASSNIDEIRSFRHSSSVTEDRADIEPARSRETSTSTYANLTDLPASFACPEPLSTQLEDADDVQSNLASTITVRTSSNRNNSSAEAQSRAEAFLQTLDLGAISGVGQHLLPVSLDEPSPRSSVSPQNNSSPVIADNRESCSGLEKTAMEILQLTRALTKAQVLKQNRMQLIRTELEDIDVKQAVRHQQVRELQQEIDTLNTEIATWDKSRHDLEDEQERIASSNKDHNTKLRQSMDKVRNVLREDINHDAHTLGTKKRKRSESK